MGRLLFKSLVVVLLVFGIGNYLIYLKTGNMPLRDMRDQFGGDWFAGLRDSVSPDQLATDAKQAVKGIADKYSGSEPAAPTKVYKWTDANGQVHFGDKPTAAGAEQVEVKIQNAISEPDDKVKKSTATAVANEQSGSESALDKARAAAEAMKQRVQQQEQMQ
ncbi:MAG: DUF4124 domain-containing protein [Cellvibrio sp.]|uniref:DUF4124 domain-containing protein n=1 Tax=Cellvibrio sp. TaxID=1965322 RepID=UPI0031AEBB8D